MPIKTFKCQTCHKEIRRLFSNAIVLKVSDEVFICTCGGTRTLVVSGPTTQVMERLDNGAMARAVERHVDAEAMMEERHRNADPFAGTKKNFS